MAGRILVKTIDGRWETLGTDRDPGNEPYGIAPSWNDWGPDTLVFNIRRDPSLEHGDLEAFTPVRYYPDGLDRPTWAGFLLERPGTDEADPSIAGAARGWQYHLDDDLFTRLHVHSDLTAWVDARTMPNATLGALPVVVNVTIGGEIVMAWPLGASIVNGTAACVTFDAGPDPANWPGHFDVEVANLAGGIDPSTAIVLRVNDSPADLFTPGTYTDPVFTNAGPGTYGGTIAAPRRYFTIMLWRGGATATLGNDLGIRVKRAILYRRDALSSGNASVLKVSDIVADAVQFAPLLSPDASLITPTTLNIPHASWHREPITPREAIGRWNAYHRFITRLAGPGLDRFEFKPQAARATLRVDTGEPGARFADASTSSGADVYNRVLVTGTSGSGEPLTVERLSANLPTAVRMRPPELQPLNPSADVDAANTFGADRDTSRFLSSPASFTNQLILGGPDRLNGVSLSFPAGAVFRRGVTYVAEVALIGASQLTGRYVAFGATNPATGDYGRAEVTIPAVGGAWAIVTVAWTPTQDRPGTQVVLEVGRTVAGTAKPQFWLDSANVTAAVANIVDRRAFRRAFLLEVGSPTDPVAMAALGDAWLGLHATTPLKGSLTVTADDAVAEFLTGRPIPADELGLHVGEVVHLANLIDPDSGAQGRNGRIAGVTPSGDGMSLTIDNERTAFEALLARMGIVGAPAPTR